MFNEERRFVIINEIETKGSVSVSELAVRFNVSEVTIRKDLKEITKYLPIKRTHGGAFLPGSSVPRYLWDNREGFQFDEKDRIGKAAAKLINQGETIILDAGTTIDRLAHHMNQVENVTCIVVQDRIAATMKMWPGISVVLTGGYVRADFPLWGPDCVRTIMAYRGADRLFLSMSAFSFETGLMETFTPSIPRKRAMIEAAGEVNLLIDSSKFNKIEGEWVAGIDILDRVITGKDAPKETIEILQKNGIDVILV